MVSFVSDHPTVSCCRPAHVIDVGRSEVDHIMVFWGHLPVQHICFILAGHACRAGHNWSNDSVTVSLASQLLQQRPLGKACLHMGQATAGMTSTLCRFKLETKQPAHPDILLISQPNVYTKSKPPGDRHTLWKINCSYHVSACSCCAQPNHASKNTSPTSAQLRPTHFQ